MRTLGFNKNGEHVESSQSYACRMLWCQCLRLAWADCFGRSACSSQEREQAVSFCLGITKEWREAREVICALAGIDADWFFEQAQKRARELEGNEAAGLIKG